MEPRRKVLAVIGDGGVISDALARVAFEVGRRAIEAGFRLVSGGLGGTMAAASEGARTAAAYTEGSVIGVLPSYDRATANPWVDVVIPSGLQIARNVLVVAMADVVIAIGGGSGTLSEMAVAWQLGRPLVALVGLDGWSGELAGRALDHRSHEPIIRAESAEQAIASALSAVAVDRPESGDIGSGWKKGVR